MHEIFIGREAELAALFEALDRAAQGTSQLVMLAGEPGVGKTRLAEHWAAACSERAHILWARCYQDQGTPPFWLWVQPLRTYLRGLDDARLAAVVADAAPALLELFPELGHRLAAIQPTATPRDPITARFRLYDAVTGVLVRACRDRPLVLVLDDLHWADAPSLLLLEYVARELRANHLLIVGTYRDMELRRNHPLARTLGVLTREQLFERLPLRRLSAEQAAALTQAVAGRSIAPEMAAAVFDRTEGNPLFVAEMARLLAGEADSIEVLRERVPEGVREAIGARLDALTQECNQTLRWAALLGEESTVEVLCDLQNDAEGHIVLRSLTEAVAAGVLLEPTSQPERYGFTHALIRETVAQDLLLSEQVRMHAAIASALSRRADATGGANAAELARHFLLAESVLGKEPALRCCSAAADQAFATHAYEAAAQWYQRGVDLNAAEPLDDLGADLLFGLARTKQLLLDWSAHQNTLAWLKRAFEYYVSSQNQAAAVEVAAVEWWGWAQWSAGLTAMVEQALQLVAPESEAAARLQLAYAIALYYEQRRLADALAALDVVEGYALRNGDEFLHGRCWLLRGELAMWELDYSKARAHLTRAAELGRPLDDIGLEARIGARGLAFVYSEEAEPAADEWFTRAVVVAERTRGGHGVAIICRGVLRHANLGDWESAKDWRHRCVNLGYDPDLYQARVDWLAGAALDSLWPRLEHILPTLVEGHRNMVVLFAGLFAAELGWETGDPDRLTLALRIARGVLEQPLVWPKMELDGRLTMGWASIVTGDPAEARRQHDRVSAMRKPPMAEVWSVERLLGMMAAACGDTEIARTHFEDAAIFLREANFRPELGWTLLHHGVLLRDQLDDQPQAAELLAEAEQIAGDLGMQPLSYHVARELDVAVKGHAWPAGLTEREVTVLRLVAHGLANKEVAAELGISPQTVAVHLRNIFDKTGARSRTEAGLFATRHGLVE